MTRVKIADINNSETNSNPHWKKLAQLQEKVTKLQARNRRKAEKIATFYLHTKAIIEPHEIEMCSVAAKRLERLIGFVARKSIKGENRDTLYNIINQEFTLLESNPFWSFDTSQLRKTFNELLTDNAQFEAQKLPEPSLAEIESFRDMLQEMLGVQIDTENEKLAEMIKNPKDFEQFLQQLAEQTQQSSDSIDLDDESEDDDDLDKAFFERAYEHFQQQEESLPSMDDIKALFKSTDLSKLYKKMAAKLHPDKEMDPSQKQHKQLLMQQLSKAKREGDIFTLLQMSQQWLPEFELDLSPAALKAMIRVMEAQIRDLNLAQAEFKQSNDIETMVWNRFSAKSKRQQQTNIQQHIDSLARHKIELQQEHESFRTVKDVNQFLKAHSLAEQWEFLDELDFFDEPYSPTPF